MSDTFHIRPGDITTLREEAYPGVVPYGERSEFGEAKNADPGTATRHVFTISAADGSDTFGFTANGTVYAHTTAAGDDSIAKAAIALAKWINETSALAALGYATPGATTVTWESYGSGLESNFTVGTLVGDWTVASTAGADAADIAFGRAVVAASKPYSGLFGDLHTAAMSMLNRFCALPSVANTGAKTIVFTFGGSYTAEDMIIVSGAYGLRDLVPIQYPAQSGAGGDLEDVLDDISGVLGSLSGVTATNTATTLTITLDAGTRGDFYVIPSANVTVTKAVTNDDQLTDKLMGVSIYSEAEDTDVLGTYATSYRANSGVPFVAKGPVYVEVSAADALLIAAGATQVYIGRSGAERGKFFAALSGDRAPVNPSRARFTAARGTLALVELS